jgi:hypothetical protein
LRSIRKASTSGNCGTLSPVEAGNFSGSPWVTRFDCSAVACTPSPAGTALPLAWLRYYVAAPGLGFGLLWGRLRFAPPGTAPPSPQPCTPGSRLEPGLDTQQRQGCEGGRAAAGPLDFKRGGAVWRAAQGPGSRFRKRCPAGGFGVVSGANKRGDVIA